MWPLAKLSVQRYDHEPFHFDFVFACVSIFHEYKSILPRTGICLCFPLISSGENSLQQSHTSIPHPRNPIHDFRFALSDRQRHMRP